MGHSSDCPFQQRRRKKNGGVKPKKKKNKNRTKLGQNQTVTSKAAYYYKVRLMNAPAPRNCEILERCHRSLLFGWQLMKFICAPTTDGILFLPRDFPEERGEKGNIVSRLRC